MKNSSIHFGESKNLRENNKFTKVFVGKIQINTRNKSKALGMYVVGVCLCKEKSKIIIGIKSHDFLRFEIFVFRRYHGMKYSVEGVIEKIHFIIRLIQCM